MPSEGKEMAIPEKKALLRREMLAIRSRMSLTDAKDAGEKILRQILCLPEIGILPEGADVALFSPIRGEPDLLSHIDLFLDRGFLLCLPRIDADQMRFLAYDKDEPLVAGRFGLSEPDARNTDVSAESIRLVLCPGLAFGRDGTRLGYGKGYYDRSFGDILSGKGPCRIGIAYSFQLLESIPNSEKDVRMDYVATPEGIYTCNPNKL